MGEGISGYESTPGAGARRLRCPAYLRTHRAAAHRYPPFRALYESTRISRIGAVGSSRRRLECHPHHPLSRSNSLKAIARDHLEQFRRILIIFEGAGSSSYATWCRERGCRLDSASRAEYVSDRLRRRDPQSSIAAPREAGD